MRGVQQNSPAIAHRQTQGVIVVQNRTAAYQKTKIHLFLLQGARYHGIVSADHVKADPGILSAQTVKGPHQGAYGAAFAQGHAHGTFECGKLAF